MAVVLRPRLVTPATVRAVDVEDMLDHLNSVTDGQSANISAYISAAIAHLEGPAGISGRCFTNQTWAVEMETWPADTLRIPLMPVSAISSVTYFDASNVSQTLNASNYRLHTDSLGVYLAWDTSAVLPSLYSRHDAVKVSVVAGYGATKWDVPATIRQAIALLASHWFENREAVIETRNRGDSFAEVPFAVTALIEPLRHGRIV